jgi:hypothetical protein
LTTLSHHDFLLTYECLKIPFLDVGLLQSAMGVNNETCLAENLLAVYKGLIAEQFAGQQLLALKKSFEVPVLYYWQREAKGSSAEVDCLWQMGEHYQFYLPDPFSITHLFRFYVIEAPGARSRVQIEFQGRELTPPLIP